MLKSLSSSGFLSAIYIATCHKLWPPLPSLCFIPYHLQRLIRKLLEVSHCIPAYQCFILRNPSFNNIGDKQLGSLFLVLSSVSFFRKTVPSMLLNNFQTLRKSLLMSLESLCIFNESMKIRGNGVVHQVSHTNLLCKLLK